MQCLPGCPIAELRDQWKVRDQSQENIKAANESEVVGLTVGFLQLQEETFRLTVVASHSQDLEGTLLSLPHREQQ